ncbi:MAG: primosomal protein N', partial [Pseudomonadales bacterium]
VYFELIEKVLRAGKQALVLVPEIGLTPQTVQRFNARFNVPISVFHSGMTDRERLTAWMAARSGAAGIIIGTRSAIFAPLKHPGLIVVDEEHDTSFKQQDGFRYSARDLAVLRGQMEQVPVILGSATPSLESWHNAKTGKYHLVRLVSRPGTTMPATYRVIDLRNLPLTEGFAPPLLEAMKRELEAHNQVLVFLNRRGYSPVLMCRECGYIAHCHRCDARLTVHQPMGVLICHHCTSQIPIPRTCPECHGADLALIGIGTQRIEQTLSDLFGKHRIIRIDRDSTRGKHNMDRFRAEIQKGEPVILVGTQLLAKGHHFPDVTLVAIVDMDAGFYSANYKASERMGQLILQVGGRAGRANKPGVVVIQTHLPDQPIFRQLIEEGYERFADRLLQERKTYELPPFHHHALIRAEATTRQAPMNFLQSIAENVNPATSVSVLGPIPASMERKAGKYRAHLLISSDARTSLKHMLAHCIELAETSPSTRKVRWSVDVDPVDLF